MSYFDSTLVQFGGAIKSFTETPDAWQFQGELIVFDSHDSSAFRDRFTKATEFFTEDGETRPVFYQHGLDATIGKAKLGTARVFIKDASVWIEGEIRKRQDYLKAHAERIASGLKQTVEAKGLNAPLFGLSSGAASHLVERKRVAGGHEIMAWPISEISITPTPAEPLTSCISLKALLGDVSDSELKVGRVLSSDTHSALLDHLEKVRAACDELEAFLEPHAPESKNLNSSLVASFPSASADIERAVLRYVREQLALNDISMLG